METTRKMLLWAAVGGILLGFLVFSGCGEKSVEEKEDPKEDQAQAGGHSHEEGPHGGEVLVVGDHVAHLEFIHHCDEGKMIFYLLDGDMKEPLVVEEGPLVNLKTADGPKQLRSKPNAEGGAKSCFEASDQELKSHHLDGQFIVTFQGKEYFLSIPEHEHPGEDHAHAHGENTISHTAWTEKCEWFVELGAPVAGQEVDFAAHVTLLEGFTPVASGTFRVEARCGEFETSTSADSPARPGIFTPSIAFLKAGEWRLHLHYEAPGLSDSIEWAITVHGDAGDIPQEEQHDSGGSLISFLKEQQWKIDFQTRWAEKKSEGEGNTIVRVPQPSVLNEGEGKIVFIQVGGESFEKRNVQIGKSKEGWIEILSGLAGSERIVSLGGAHLLNL